MPKRVYGMAFMGAEDGQNSLSNQVPRMRVVHNLEVEERIMTTTKRLRQNAAESLPAQPEQGTPWPHLPHATVTVDKETNDKLVALAKRRSNGYTGDDPTPEPVAPVEAKEEKWIKCPYCGRLSEGGKYHEQQCEAPVKPQPDSSSIPEVQTVEPAIKLLADVMHLWVDGYISKNPNSQAYPSISDAIFVEIESYLATRNISVDYCGWRVRESRDSSSISTEQTFEDVLRNRAGEYQDMGREHRKNEEYAAACCCEDKASGLYVAIKLYRSWAAAKGAETR